MYQRVRQRFKLRSADKGESILVAAAAGVLPGYQDVNIRFAAVTHEVDEFQLGAKEIEVVGSTVAAIDVKIQLFRLVSRSPTRSKPENQQNPCEQKMNQIFHVSSPRV